MGPHRHRPWPFAWPAAAVVALFAPPSAAVEPASTGSAAPPADDAPRFDAPPGYESAAEEALRQAKELFRLGNALRASGNYDRALDYYRRSRALVASVPNTLNAALCLEQLGRFDEAFELYEELLGRFENQLGDNDRLAILPALATLQKKLAKLEVSANIEGTLVVDGRLRGTLPLATPLPVLPGDRLVRIVKDGFETFEKRVTLEPGKTISLDARLARLARVGRLRVDDAELAGADLYVDGGMVGKLPWDGTLLPGEHLYFVRKGDFGSAPALAIVVEGQTVLVGVAARPLGPETAIVVEPPTASLFVDGVPLGKGVWRGRLPFGDHALEARETGYHTATRVEEIGSESSGRIVLALRVDGAHPRWAVAEQARFRADAFGGLAVASSLGSGAEAQCEEGSCSGRTVPLGAMAGVRAAYVFPVELSLELAGGYLALASELTRTVSHGFGQPGQQTQTSYTYSDSITMAGPFVTGGIAYHRAVLGRLGLGARLHLGVAFPENRDVIEATASAGGRTVAAEVQGSGTAVRSTAFFAVPEVEATVKLGKLSVGVGFGVGLFALDGPPYDTGETRVTGTCDPNQTPLPIECARRENLVAGERAYGPFALWLPRLGAGYTF